MPEESLGAWQPLELRQVVRLFERWAARWWITGGMALELHLGRSWRSHDDSDVSILRTDATGLLTVLAGWDIHIAAAGSLIPWDGRAPRAATDQNNMWCRTAPDSPWCLDVTLSDGDRACWVYRRDPTLRVPWPEAVFRTDQGVPYLNPVIQLLFKSRNNRPKDDRDAREVVPALSLDQRGRLSELLPLGHPWQALLVT
jgi:hypothetical protein